MLGCWNVEPLGQRFDVIFVLLTRALSKTLQCSPLAARILGSLDISPPGPSAHGHGCDAPGLGQNGWELLQAFHQ